MPKRKPLHHVVVEFKKGRTLHRVKTNGPMDKARESARAAGLNVTAVFEEDPVKDVKVPYVYDLEDWEL